MSTRDTRVAERKRKQEALEAAKTGAGPAAQKPRRDEIALSSDHLTCPICREILDNAVETACAHVYCENCVAIQIANGHKKCAVCRATIKAAELRPCMPIRRIVSDMDTTCTNAECKWKGTRGNLQDHELVCSYAIVACEYGHDKCGTRRRMDLKKHHVSECLYFICKCTLGCGQSFPRRDLSKHKKACPNARAACERCGQSVRRKEMPHHSEYVCAKSKVHCFAAGCKGTMLREQLGGHILSNLGPHLCALATAARIADAESKRLALRVEAQERALAALAETVAELKAAGPGAPAEEASGSTDTDSSGAASEDGADSSAASEDDDDDDEADGDEEEEEEESMDDVDADGSGANGSSSVASGDDADADDAEEEDDEDEDEDEEEEDAEDAAGAEASSSSSSDSDEEEGGESSSESDSDDAGVMYRLADPASHEPTGSES